MKNIWYKLQDMLVIIRGAWFIIIFNMLAFVAFIAVAQGRDVLLMVMENTGAALSSFHPENLWQLSGLAVALFFWSVAAEFGSRVMIYLSDNSGRSLDPARVNSRKRYQKKLARFALFYPVILLACGFASAYATNYHILYAAGSLFQPAQIFLGFTIIIFILFLEFLLLWRLYPGQLISRWSEKYRWLRWIMISKQENEWADKLYGIFNDVRIDLSSSAPFEGADLPRGRELPNGIVIPDSPDFIPCPGNPQHPGGELRTWMFQIRPRFYHNLIRQLLLLALVSTVLLVTIGLLLPVSGDIKLGATAIICFAFAAWTIIYVMLHFLDKLQPFPVRLALFIWLVICSFCNHDHPVRLLNSNAVDRPGLRVHFNRWLAHLAAEKDSTYYRINTDTIPVVFISAEGGALRTGAFTGLLLARLQEKFPEFKNYIYAFSSVSGGTVGSNFFNAQVIRSLREPEQAPQWRNAANAFFKTDFLSAVTAKLVFGEVINCFSLRDNTCGDRAIALEKGFEQGWINAYGQQDINLLSNSFDVTVNAAYPAVFINTTEVETGLQKVWSNVVPAGIPLDTARDLYRLQPAAIRYSSAINLSDRFPLVSPAGCFFTDGITERKYSRHFVDGGYYENKGSETLYQVIRTLNLGKLKVKPYVLQFNFGGDTVIKSVTRFNEIAEIGNGIYNTRNGRGRIAEQELKDLISSLHGVFIPLNPSLSSDQLPMNWALSNTAIDGLDHVLGNFVNYTIHPFRQNKNSGQLRPLLSDTAQNALRNLFFYDDINRYGHNAYSKLNMSMVKPKNYLPKAPGMKKKKIK